MPTFARPIDGRQVRRAPTSPYTLSALMPLLSLVTLSCAALFLFARPDSAESLPAGKADAAGHKRSTAAAHKAKASANKPTENAVPGANDRQGLDFYTSNVRDGMFSAPQPPRPKPTPPPVQVQIKPPKVEPIKVVLPVINPFAEWSYTGTVHMGDMIMALLENTRTKEGQYVKPGDSFMGAQVKSINDQMVTLMNAGKPSMLAKADTIIITPLNGPAPGSAPPPGGPQNGQPNPQAPMMGGAPGDANQPSITLPNGRVLRGDRATRYQQRLDRGFGGGGGGGRRGGGATPAGGG